MPGTVGRQKRSQVHLCQEQAASVEDLYRQYSSWLGAALQRKLRFSGSEVEDIVQDTYIRVARYSPADMARYPKALLLRIGMNLARDRFRKDARLVTGRDGWPDGAEPTCAAEQQDLLELKRIVMSLPQPLRDVFLLSRFTRLTYAEIAVHLGISVKTVEWRMTKALAICAARLRD
jgi:RNA polymerase sigma-70 factor (ECF subfamily)